MKLSDKHLRILRKLSKMRTIAVAECEHPRCLVTLARHGLIEARARITEKGRGALEDTKTYIGATCECGSRERWVSDHRCHACHTRRASESAGRRKEPLIAVRS